MHDAYSPPSFDPTDPASWKALRAEAMLAEASAHRGRRLAEEEARRGEQPVQRVPAAEERFRKLLSTWYVGYLTYRRRPWILPGRPMVERVNEHDGSTMTVGPYVGQPLGIGETVQRMHTPEYDQGIEDPEHPGFRMNETQLETKYGVGRFEERRARLDDVLGGLASRGVDLGKVLDALEVARGADQQARQEGYRVDAARFMYGERDALVRRLRKAVHEALNLYDRAMHLLFDSAAGVRVTISVETTELLARLAERLNPDHEDRDPLWTAPSPVPQRRARAGRLPKPWLPELRTRLRAAGVRPREISDLLTAVGLATRSQGAAKRATSSPSTSWPKRAPCLKCGKPRRAAGPSDRLHEKCRSRD